MGKYYQEGPDSTVTHHGVQYRLDPLLVYTHRRLIRAVPVERLTWILHHCLPDPQRVRNADCQVPILIYYDPKCDTDKWFVIDGLHRLARAVEQGRKFIPARLIPATELAKARVT